jgi:transglutaminase-like putative cysteine protease
MLSALAEHDPREMQQSFAAADRRIRNRGLSYRVPGEKDERTWPISRMTEVSTPASEAFDRRRGVCQDFAHIMIAALRDIALPALYVSGYIRM